MRVHYKYEPMREVGGDFLFIQPLSFPPTSAQRWLSVVVMDVTGHGVAAAMAVNRLHAELTRIYAAEGEHEPGEVIGKLNRFTFEALAPAGIFATAICLRVDARATNNTGIRRLEWANAGHPPALLRHVTDKVDRLETTAPMLGVVDGDEFDAAPRAGTVGALQVLVVYTDGAVETSDRRGEQLGIEGLERLLADVSVETMTTSDGVVAASLLAGVTAHRHGPTKDDILIVEVEVAARDTASAQRDRLLRAQEAEV